MNWAALRHLCWVLLILNGVSGGEEDQSPRPTTVRLRRPIRRNSIKKSAEDDFKPSVFPDDPSSTTGSTRFTSKRTNAVDYLARNTVPVASVTETSRKPFRPPPAHLLTYQALSSTEKGSDSTNEPNLPPTGWALASLVPSKNSSLLVPKKNNISLGTTRPLTSYWSTRLRRPPALRTTPITPIEAKDSNKGDRSSTALAIPAENLIKDDINATVSKVAGDSQSVIKESVPGSSNVNRENVLEKPANLKKVVTPTSQAGGFQPTTDNTRNNLIKELRGGDIGSKILHGIVAVTNASEYLEGVDRQTEETRATQKVDVNKSQDDTNVVDEKVQLVTRKSEYGTSAGNTITAPPLVQLTTPQEPPSTSKVTTPTVIITSPESSSSSKEMLPTVLAASTKTASSSELTSPTDISTSVEMSTPSSSSTKKSQSSEDYEETSSSSAKSELPTDFLTVPKFTNIATLAEGLARSQEGRTPTTPGNFTNPQSTETEDIRVSADKSESSDSTPLPTEAVTSSVFGTSSETNTASSVSYVDDVDLTSGSAHEPQNFTTLPSVDNINTATTVSQEANDIPEPYTRVKSDSDKEKSSIGSSEALPTTTPLTPNLNDGSSILGSPASFGRMKTTTEVMEGVATSTQNILETTALSKGEKVENETATTLETLATTDFSKEELTTNSSQDVPSVTVNTQPTSRSGDNPWIRPVITEYTGMDSTTNPSKSHNEGASITTTTEFVHIGLSERPDDDHDETLKYNVTTADHPQGNGTDPDESLEEPEDDAEKDSDVHTTTTLVIIEEITTHKTPTSQSTALPKSTTVTTPPPLSTTKHSNVNQDAHPPTTEGTEESPNEPRLRLTFLASFKEMCLARDSLAEAIAAHFKETSPRPIQPKQVKILNLSMTECASKSLPLTEKVPVFVQITDAEGKGDQNLTEILYSYIKRNSFNFKYPLANVEPGYKLPIMDEDNQWGGTVIAAVVISSVAGVSLLCLTILLMIMRKRQKGFTYGQRCTPVSLEDYSLDNISVFNSVRRKAMRASKRSYGNPAFDDPVTVTNPLNFVGLSNMANSHQKIDNEYSEVPTVTVKPDELPPGAESKNRYANVIPIPETRVPLRGPDGEELFINANFVKGVKGADKFYIACQAPLESTVADFWTMIWEQQSQVILMLTDLHENGVEKCADYLPTSEVLDCHRVFGNLQVTLKKREVREKYVISSLQLKNLESNLWREVIHLWYTGWPIRGVPEDLPSIIAYLIEARSYSKPGHPIVVHCSPGTGRTGTIIAIDIAIRDFETDRAIDIPKTVYGIRRDRAGAVQTNLQYYMIYQVIHLYATKLTGGSFDSI